MEFNSKTIKNTIRYFKYNDLYFRYRTYKDEDVEKSKFPCVNLVFYKYIFYKGDVPDPQTLLDLYFQEYADEIIVSGDSVEVKGRTYRLVALKARCLRTYPSLLRDFYFYLLLKESGLFEEIRYSCKEDLRGIDITVKYNRNTYVISLFTNTARAWEYKNIKSSGRHRYGDNEIIVAIDLKDAYACGDIKLYTQKDVETVINCILEKERQSGM